MYRRRKANETELDRIDKRERDIKYYNNLKMDKKRHAKKVLRDRKSAINRWQNLSNEDWELKKYRDREYQANQSKKGKNLIKMSWKINNKFAYPKSMRSIYNGSRHYDVSGDKYPSVTNILAETKSQEDKDALNKWKKDVGFKEAAIISKQSSERGTTLHQYLESILLNKMNGELLEEINLPKKMAETIVDNGINNQISEVFGCEAVLYYDGNLKFAGTADAVINSSDNEIKILDFKQSNKPKKREYSVINEYGLQLALYSIAHDNMFGTKIKSTEILMCTPNLIFQKFEFKDQEFEKLKKEAMNRVEQYYNLKRRN